MATMDQQGLWESRVRQDCRASLGHRDREENQGPSGRLVLQDTLDLQGCRTITIESTPSSGPWRLLLGPRDSRKTDEDMDSEVICTKRLNYKWQTQTEGNHPTTLRCNNPFLLCVQDNREQQIKFKTGLLKEALSWIYDMATTKRKV